VKMRLCPARRTTEADGCYVMLGMVTDYDMNNFGGKTMKRLRHMTARGWSSVAEDRSTAFRWRMASPITQ